MQCYCHECRKTIAHPSDRWNIRLMDPSTDPPREIGKHYYHPECAPFTYPAGQK